MILDEILAHKRIELDEVKRRVRLAEVKRLATEAPPPCDFRAGLVEGESVSVIAEVKKASPSAGVIREDFDPVALARGYHQAGARAVSVLTDQRYFQGCLDDVRRIRQAVTIPILRKEFVIDPYQVYEARGAGSDAVLLIAAALAKSELVELIQLAGELGMSALVEVHDRSELDQALEADAVIIGINNRDLADFKVDIDTTCALAPLVPDGRIVVSESGIRSRADVARVAASGADAVLVGTSVVCSTDPSGKVR